MSLLRVQLPNKENTVVQVQEEWVMQEILRVICEKRQFDPRDYRLTYENGKKKEEELDLTLQFRQYDSLKEVTLQKGSSCLLAFLPSCQPQHLQISPTSTTVKKKSVLLPASSKDTNLRSLSHSASNLDQQLEGNNDSAQSLVVEGAFAQKGRTRSISATMKPMSRSASLQADGQLLKDHYRPSLQLSASPSSSFDQQDDSSQTDGQGSEITLVVPSLEAEESSDSIFSSAEEVAREKIL